MAALIGASCGTTGLAVMASPAMASKWEERVFCENNMEPGGTCPPNGVNGGSEWGHIEEVQGNAKGAEHETCVDVYIEEHVSKTFYYTAAKCMTKAGETARWYGDGLAAEELNWGQPRAWNGGSVTHVVWGYEYYLKTS
ncbi:MAG TPA: hypothetical protein VGF95_05905 [Solirubrobacteraceae bacterium]|jgi:hypothetical protein